MRHCRSDRRESSRCRSRSTPTDWKSFERPTRRRGALRSFADLRTGDIIVHEDHGIARFAGFDTKTVADVTRDYLELEYAGTDRVFLPVDQLAKISRYVGADGNEGDLIVRNGDGTEVIHLDGGSGDILLMGADLAEEFAGSSDIEAGSVLIATKFGIPLDAERTGGARPAYLRRAVEDSLRRLGTDYIDLYQLHRPDPEVPITETLGALDELVRAGKLREIGCSNFSAEQLRQSQIVPLMGAARFVSLQNEYSLLQREPERAVLAGWLKRLRLPVNGTLGFGRAEVTAGGVALDEVDSRTMQSKLVPGLYLAGELLDLDGPIGGYNFQAAWSTGWLAGTKAAGSLWKPDAPARVG